ncbi:DUF4260 domain-containing protein [Methylocystis sp.]|jgi:hypothetical protein|uniref:DUF4260 domain-containing protein n=1 Tax=Methylocystis sp. TaxID=1911079 RepID=UPI003D110CE1
MTIGPDARSDVSGRPNMLLRFEGAALLAAASFAYWRLGASWGQFALLFLVPDISMLGYLAGPRVGAIAYNAAHTTIGPVSLGALGLFFNNALLLQLALIHLAHIGFDRALGYGLKFGTAFRDTHLGRIGGGASYAPH